MGPSSHLNKHALTDVVFGATGETVVSGRVAAIEAMTGLVGATTIVAKATIKTAKQTKHKRCHTKMWRLFLRQIACSCDFFLEQLPFSYYEAAHLSRKPCALQIKSPASALRWAALSLNIW